MKGRPPHRPPATAEHPLIAQAVGLHQAGRLAEAARLYEQIIAQVPRHFDAMHLLGVIALQEGRHDQAERLIKSALQANPNHAAALGNLGTVYLRMGKLEAAHRQFERVVRMQPNADVPLTNLGTVLRQMGRSQEALVPLRRAFGISPKSAPICNLLGACLLDTGDAGGAAKAFQAATLADPAGADGWANLAIAVNRSTDHAAALAIATNAVAMQPRSSAARALLASVQLEQGHSRAAIATYREAVALPSPSAQTLCAFGNALMRSGLCVEARKTLQRAIEIDGDSATARLALAMGWCEPMFARAAEIEPARAAFEQSLADLRTWFQAARRPDAFAAVGSNQPFFLAYQPYNNRELLQRYGSLCVEWMGSMPVAKAPGAKARRQGGSGGRAAADRRIRVGFVSASIRDHSVWHAITKGWVLNLDREQFATHLFHLGRTRDHETELVKQHATAFVDAPNSLQTWIEAIAAASPDVLIFPEIGMDALTAQLASLRLAPVQAAAWGHPETTGLPTMDLYLSAEDLEPQGAGDNYSERLVRLPALGVFVEPLAPMIPPLDLHALGLPADEPLLLCAGAPFKYSPLHDRVWARIAAGLHAANGGWLVFFRGRDKSMEDLLEQRLRGAFEREGVDFDAHVCMIPTLRRPDFFALMQRSALLLDTLGFSGFNTALQALECGLPVLAHEGPFMRSRLASAMLRRLGLPELVTTTEDAFIARAVRLAGDAQARQLLTRQVESRREILFRDLEPVRALERTLSDALHRGPDRR